MKRILLLLIILFGLNGLAQVTVYSEDFNSATVVNLPAGWTKNHGSVFTDNSLNFATCIPACNVVGSSASIRLMFTEQIGAAITRYAESPAFSTLGKTAMTMTLNQIRQPLSTMSFSVYFSIDGGSTFPHIANFTNVPLQCTNWTSVASFAVPAAVDNQTSVKFRIIYIGGTINNKYTAFDDIRITGLNSPVYYYNGTGLIDALTSWGLNPNGSGANPTSFTAAGQVFNFTNAASINLSNMSGSSITFSGVNTIVHMGLTATANNLNMIIPATHTLFLGSGAGMQVNNQTTLTLQNTDFPTSISSVTLDTGSAVDYAQSSGLISPIESSHYDMYISGGADIEPVGDFTVTNNFDVSNGALSMFFLPFYTTYLNGPINFSGSGSIKTGYSNLCIQGSGVVGTINFVTGYSAPLIAVNAFTLNRSGQTLILGGDLEADDVFISNGSVNLNGKTFKSNGPAVLHSSAAAGVFIGSNSSSMTFTNGVPVTNSLFMDQTSSSTRSLKSLTTQNSLTLGNALEVRDSVKISGGTLTTGGNLTLKSTSALKGRIAEITGGGSISGNITVETFAQGGVTDWTNLGAAGVDGLNLSSWDNPATFPMTCLGCINATTSVGGGFASAVRWDESLAGNAAYVTMSNTDLLTPGKGFWMFLGLTYITTADMNWSVTGPPVMGPVSIPLTVSAQAGYNLISNPYASPIRWSLLRASNSGIVNDVYYVYDPDMGLTRSFVSGLTAPTGTQVAYDIIPAGQGFYVEATGVGGNLTANESNKVSFNTGANQLLKSSENNSTNSSIGSYLRVNIDGGGYHDDAIVRFHTNATNNFDGELDAHKWYASPGYAGYPGAWTKRTVIGTQINNEDYSINSLPHSLTQNAVLPVVARVYTSGSYTISASDIQNIPAGTCINLKDHYTNTTHDLTASDYIVNMSDTTYYARFELTICPFNVATGIKTQVKDPNSIAINKDAKGIFVDFDFKNTTKANITVTNILGQKIMDTKKVKVTNDNVYLDLNVNDQLIFVTVETENEKVTKKFLNFR